jgi:hypothetical protein
MIANVSSNKAMLAAFQSVFISWGDVDGTFPMIAAQRIRTALQTANVYSQPALQRVQHAGEPPPLPWRLALMATETIEAATQMTQLANLMPENVGAPTRAAISKRLTSDVDDDWCWTPYRKWPFPPRKLGDLFDRADHILSAVLFHTAAESVNDEVLGRAFAGIADRLLERAMQGA